MVNEEQKLNYIVLPQEVNNYNVSFENSNNTVLQVNQDGTIKGISVGKSIVKVKINNTYEASINVNVLSYVVHVESLILKSNANLTLNVNDTSEILYEINPSNASNKTVSFTSSNIKVATVDSNGIIKAISKGSAIITVKTSDKEKVVNVNVVVN